MKGRLHLDQGTILVLLVDILVDLVFRLELRQKLAWRMSRDPALDASWQQILPGRDVREGIFYRP